MVAPAVARAGVVLTPRHPAAAPLLVCALASLLTAMAAFPVLQAPHQRIFGSEIVGRHHDPFTVMRQFAGAPVAPPYQQPGTDLGGRALARVIGPVAAYNAIVLLTFPLAALFAFLLARAMTGSAVASGIAALAFAFAPFHLAQAAYHPHIAQVQWLPMFLWLLWRAIHGFTAARGVALGLALIWVVVTNAYGGLIAITVGAIAVPLFWRVQRRDGTPPQRRDLYRTIGALAAAAAALAVAALVTGKFAIDFASLAVDRGDVLRYSASAWAYVVPSVEHPWLGPAARGFWAAHGVGLGLLEQQLFLGYGLMLLALIAAVAPHAAGLTSSTRWAIVAILVVSLVSSMPISIEFNGLSVPGPMMLLHAAAPMFRSYARFGVMVQLCVALLAGAAAAAWWRRGGVPRAVAAALLLLAMIEYTPAPWRYRDVLPTTGHRWLAGLEQEPVVFECALPSLSQNADAWLAGYFIGYLQPAVADCGEPGLAAKLRALGFSHLVIRDTRHDIGRGFALAHHEEDSAVFEIVALPADVYVAGMDGWFAREGSGPLTWRWSEGAATLVLVNAGADDIVVKGSLELWSYGGPRRISAALNGRVADEWVVETRPVPYEIGPYVLARGRHEIALHAAEPPLVPRDVEAGSSDGRRLAMAIGQWQLIADAAESR